MTSLTDCIRANYKELDLLGILTVNSQKVAYDYESKTELKAFTGMKQMPVTMTMLTRRVYFNEPKSSNQGR